MHVEGYKIRNDEKIYHPYMPLNRGREKKEKDEKKTLRWAMMWNGDPR